MKSINLVADFDIITSFFCNSILNWIKCNYLLVIWKLYLFRPINSKKWAPTYILKICLRYLPLILTVIDHVIKPWKQLFFQPLNEENITHHYPTIFCYSWFILWYFCFLSTDLWLICECFVALVQFKMI